MACRFVAEWAAVPAPGSEHLPPLTGVYHGSCLHVAGGGVCAGLLRIGTRLQLPERSLASPHTAVPGANSCPREQ